MPLALMVGILLVGALVARRRGLPSVNAVTVLAAAWIPIMSASSIPGILEPSLEGHTWLLILLAITSLCVGALTFPVAAGVKFNGERAPKNRTVNWFQVRHAHTMFSGLLLVHAISQVYASLPSIQAAGGFGQLFSAQSSSAGAYKISLVATNAAGRQSTFNGGGAIVGLINYVTFLGLFSLFTGALLWLRKERRRAVIPLLIVAAYSFLSLERTSIAMAALLFGFSVLSFARFVSESSALARTKSGKKRTRQPGTTVMIWVMGLAALLTPLEFRNQHTSRSTGIQSLLEYVMASVGGLNAKFVDGGGQLQPPVDIFGHAGPAVGYGTYTFANLFSVLHRFGFPIDSSPAVYDYITISIASQRFSSNIATSFFDFYMDAGWAGVVIFPFLLGLLTSASQLRSSRSGPAWVPFTALLLGTIFWSFFANVMTRDIRYVVLACVSIILIKRMRLFEPSVSEVGEAEKAIGDSLPLRSKNGEKE